MDRNFGRGEDAISPVIGVILMVAIAVILTDGSLRIVPLRDR